MPKRLVLPQPPKGKVTVEMLQKYILDLHRALEQIELVVMSDIPP